MMQNSVEDEEVAFYKQENQSQTRDICACPNNPPIALLCLNNTSIALLCPNNTPIALLCKFAHGVMLTPSPCTELHTAHSALAPSQATVPCPRAWSVTVFIILYLIIILCLIIILYLIIILCLIILYLIIILCLIYYVLLYYIL